MEGNIFASNVHDFSIGFAIIAYSCWIFLVEVLKPLFIPSSSFVLLYNYLCFEKITNTKLIWLFLSVPDSRISYSQLLLH